MALTIVCIFAAAKASIITMTKERQSNFELLRLMAMLMILMLHFDGAALGLPLPEQYWSCEDWLKTLIESWSIIGVNLFVMISGYFGIRLTSSRLISYVGMCIFYSVGIYLLWLLFSPAAASTTRRWLDAVLVFSHGDLWFVRDYLMLMLLAPLLNGGLQSLDRRQLGILMISLAIINCYFGWWNNGKVNPTGYCLMQLISLYILGHWLRKIRLSSKSATVLWLMGYGLTVVMAAFMSSAKSYAYNSPAVILASVGMFMIFANVRLRSRGINALASHSFAVYLIHKNPYVWILLKHNIISQLNNSAEGAVFLLYMAVLTLIVYSGSIAVDKVRSTILARLTAVMKKYRKITRHPQP